jgi:hypothetical protein
MRVFIYDSVLTQLMDARVIWLTRTDTSGVDTSLRYNFGKYTVFMGGGYSREVHKIVTP